MASYNDSGKKSFTTSEAVVAYRAATISNSSGSNVAGLTAAGGRVDGIFADDASSGANVDVNLLTKPGTHKVMVSGACTNGDYLYPAASGKFTTTATAGRPALIAMETATADGDIIEARVPNHHMTGEPLVSAGATLTLTAAAHGGKTILLDMAAGSVVTLPAATGSGTVFKFRVTTVPTSNFHQVKVANSSDTMSGSVNILDNDAAAQGAYAATGTDDNIQLNGTTKGGLIGDYVEVIDLKTNVWGIFGQLVVPAGSNPADVFSAAV